MIEELRLKHDHSYFKFKQVQFHENFQCYCYRLKTLTLFYYHDIPAENLMILDNIYIFFD